MPDQTRHPATPKPISKPGAKPRDLPFESIALLLQGGGALGAYQAGVYQALDEAGIYPTWLAGISIGAINAAIIAGNPPHERINRLRQFWERITTPFTPPGLEKITPDSLKGGDMARGMLNQFSAGACMFAGAPGFFAPRMVPSWLSPDGSPAATSYYDTSPLKGTLERLIDFDRINAGEIRLSVGAVNVASGNFVYFDSAAQPVRVEHVMASGALPPAFPPIEIDGEFYWDGGLVSNTPLQWVTENCANVNTLAFQVDLWSATGDRPANMAEVITRQKEIQYSSRTRANTTRFKHIQKMRAAIARLIAQLPPEMKGLPDAQLLAAAASSRAYNIIHLIYRTRHYEGHSKDYEFSRLSMEDHWRAGYHDTVRTLRHPQVLQTHSEDDGLFTFDLARDGGE